MALITLLLLGIPLAHPSAAVQAEARPVLLLTDSMAIGTSKEGNVEALQRVLASFGTEVTLESFDTYEPGTLAHYNHVIVVRNADDYLELPERYKQDFETYEGRYLHIGTRLPDQVREGLALEETRVGQDAVHFEIGSFTETSMPVNGISYITQAEGKRYGTMTSDLRQMTFPYGVMNGRYAYVPYFERGSLSELAIGYLLRDWLAMPGSGQYYALIRDIYPFSNLDLVNRMADRLYEAGIPFIASVRPVLSNSDYPAMKRYMETLKHVQARNGSLVVSTPMVTASLSQDVATLKAQMGAFLDAMAEYGIAPLGIGAEMYWTYDRHYISRGLAFFDSIVLFPNERPVYRAKTNTSVALASTVYTLKEEEFRRMIPPAGTAAPPPMDTAIVYDCPEDEKRLEDTLHRLLSEWTPFADYKNAPHAVRTDAHVVLAQHGQLEIDGRGLAVNSALQEISSEHVYVQAGKKSLDALFTVQNRIFIVLIGLTLVVFSGLFVIGRRMYKRKYTGSGSGMEL